MSTPDRPSSSRTCASCTSRIRPRPCRATARRRRSVAATVRIRGNDVVVESDGPSRIDLLRAAAPRSGRPACHLRAQRPGAPVRGVMPTPREERFTRVFAHSGSRGRRRWRPVGLPCDERPEHPTDGLVSRVHLIDERPLEERAAAYSQVHDELRATLEERLAEDLGVAHGQRTRTAGQPIRRTAPRSPPARRRPRRARTRPLQGPCGPAHRRRPRQRRRPHDREGLPPGPPGCAGRRRRRRPLRQSSRPQVARRPGRLPGRRSTTHSSSTPAPPPADSPRSCSSAERVG